jgi:membrane protein YqaA with SNARE-associated domain
MTMHQGLARAVSFIPNQVRRVYDWMLSWAERPGAGPFLFFIALAEASFFPIPPDVLLMALALSQPKRSLRWAGICLAGSVTGGIIGYGLGYFFMEIIGDRILAFYHLTDKYIQVQQMYQQYEGWAVAAGGFTPLPYKLFTITAGGFRVDFATFLLASVISRGMRFYLIALLIYYFGPGVRHFLEKYFNTLTIIFMLLLIGGFVVMKWLF